MQQHAEAEEVVVDRRHFPKVIIYGIYILISLAILISFARIELIISKVYPAPVANFVSFVDILIILGLVYNIVSFTEIINNPITFTKRLSFNKFEAIYKKHINDYYLKRGNSLYSLLKKSTLNWASKPGRYLAYLFLRKRYL